MYKFADIQVNVGMADFQHVVPVHAAQVRKRKQSFSQNDNEHLGSGTFFSDIFYLCGLQDYCNVAISSKYLLFAGWQIRQDIRKQMMEMS